MKISGPPAAPGRKQRRQGRAWLASIGPGARDIRPEKPSPAGTIHPQDYWFVATALPAG